MGLGPTTREAAETTAVQTELLRALVARGFGTVVLQDSTEIGERLDRWVRTSASVDPVEDLDAVLADAWGPWRVEPVRLLLTWLRDHNLAHPDDPGQQVEVRGVFRPKAVPADYDHVLALTAGTDGHGQVRELLETIRVAHDGGEHVERAHGRWHGPPYVDLARRARGLVESADGTDARARAQALTGLDRIIDFHATSLSQGHDALAEDIAAADRLVDHLAATGRRAVVWDGIAHLMAHGRTFGGRLREHLGPNYRCVVTTFGSGAIRNLQLPTPAAGSLDATLQRVADAVGGACIIDLAGPAPDHVLRWLADTHPSRMISGMYRPDEDERHYLAVNNLSTAVDVLIHLPQITPVQDLT
ncbi:erythromycin esterase family protein [Jannaschia sp. R86511]|uniref:erythromycin esterase family protein n=1 Tax=Jannaschia sp. R86511 TaxID=3093853 RepID=UPI0036D22206